MRGPSDPQVAKLGIQAAHKKIGLAREEAARSSAGNVDHV